MWGSPQESADSGSARKLVVFVPILCLLLSSGLAYAGVASDETRVFYADDPDPRDEEFPDFGYIDLSFLSEDESPEGLAEGYDFYYYSTRPSRRVPPSNVTLAEYRSNQLNSVSRAANTSKWPNTAPERKDGEYVKDAYIAFMGIEGGAQYGGADSELNGTYLIDRNGAVLNMLDFRTELPAGDCTEDLNYELINGTQTLTNGTRICITYSLSDATVRRTVSIGGEEWTAVGDERRIEFTDADAKGKTTLTIEATIGVKIAKRTDRDSYNRSEGWVDVSETTDLLESSVTVSDSRPVLVSSNQELTVKQRVISISEKRKAVVLTIEGPSDLSERQLWGRAMFSNNQSLLNVWGVYSARQYHGGKVIANGDDAPRNYHFPHTLDTYITARAEKPAARTHFGGDISYVAIPELVEYNRQPAGPTNATLPENVHLETARPYLYHQIVITNAPGRITKVEDIHGNEIPVETTVEPFHQTEIKATAAGDDQVQLRLVDVETGEPVSGRTLLLGGAEEDTVTTNSNGVAVVKPTEQFITARFAGDDWRADRALYLGSSSVSFYTGDGPDFVDAFVNIFYATRWVVFWVIVLVIVGRFRWQR